MVISVICVMHGSHLVGLQMSTYGYTILAERNATVAKGTIHFGGVPLLIG